MIAAYLKPPELVTKFSWRLNAAFVVARVLLSLRERQTYIREVDDSNTEQDGGEDLVETRYQPERGW